MDTKNNVLDAVRERTTYIGASDAAGVLGKSRWNTPLSIWAEKTGQIAKEDGTNVSEKSWGKRHEPAIIEWFEEQTGKKVVGMQQQHFDAEHAFLGATVDGIIDGEGAGFEAKTCAAWKSKEWEGEEIPEEYILQAYHSMMVTRLKKWYIAVLIGGNNAHWKEVVWDDKIISEIRRREVFFWREFIEKKEMPAMITRRDTDTLDALFPVAEAGKIVPLGDEANILVENLTAMKQDAKALENQIEATENQLKAMIQDAEAGVTNLYTIGWTNSKWSGLDGKTLKLELPEVHARYYRSKPTRRFGYKPLKGE